MSAEFVSALAAAISAAAALVSLIVAIFAIRLQSQATKPRLRVTVTTAMTASGPSLSDAYYLVTAENRGIVPIVLTSFGFTLANGQTYVDMDPREPMGASVAHRKLEPGEAVGVAFDIRELAQAHIQRGVQRAFVDTAAAGRFTSEPVDGRALATWARA